MGQGAAILPDGEFPVSWGRDPVRDALCVGDLPYSDEWRSVSSQEMQPKSNSFSALKQKSFQAEMMCTSALEFFFF